MSPSGSPEDMSGTMPMRRRSNISVQSCGTSSLAAKQRRYFPPSSLGVFLRPHLAKWWHTQAPDVPVNTPDPKWITGWGKRPYDWQTSVSVEQQLLPNFIVSAGYFRTLRDGHFDLAIDLQGLLRSGLMARATKAPRRVGLAGARARPRSARR